MELFEEHENTNFYSIRFKDEESTEFEKFYDKYDNNPVFKDDLDKVVYWINKIGEQGALERHFRPEKGNLKALPCPIDLSSTRLYCYRVTDGIVILGNGGIKKTRTYNEDPMLNVYAETIFSIGNILVAEINKDKIRHHNNTLYGQISFTIDIPE